MDVCGLVCLLPLREEVMLLLISVTAVSTTVSCSHHCCLANPFDMVLHKHVGAFSHAVLYAREGPS